MPRQCPFCKEEINDDAIKCKHCHSMLYKLDPVDTTKPEDAKNSSRHITYVVDNDLVRFAKFSLSLLAIFITVGVILYGVDLKQTVKEVNEVNANLDEANRKISASLPKIDSLGREITDIRKEVDDARAKATEALREINSSREQAVQLVAFMRKLDPGQLKNSDAAGFITKLDFENLWTLGQTIRIYFMNGTPAQKEKTQKIAEEWTQFANLKFAYVNDAQSSDIRISFDETQTWSYVGTQCLAVSKSEPTMALIVSIEKVATSDDRSIVLRNFGFMLGLLSEHQNPNAQIKWNKATVYANYAAPPNNWSRSTVDQNFFTVWKSKSKPFDPKSVMMIPIEKKLTLDGFHSNWHEQLSSMDKNFVARLYPISPSG